MYVSLSRWYLILSSIVFAVLSVETITYTGFFQKYSGIDARLLLVPLCLLGIWVCATSFTPHKHPTNIIAAYNTFFLLPLTLICTGIFTLTEYLHFPNYVYSTFHLHFDGLYYLFVVSLVTTIVFIPKKVWQMYHPYLLFAGSVILIATGSCIRIWPQYIFFTLSLEDHLFETIQVVCYGFAALFALIQGLRNLAKKQLFYAAYFFLFFILLLFITGEEISWGQRIFGFSSSAYLKAHNYQQETTIHNINGLHQYQYLIYMAFSFILATSWMVAKLLSKKLQSWILPIIPGWQYMLYFLPIGFYYLSVNFLNSPYTEWQEYAELVLASGLFLFFLQTLLSRKT